MLDLRRPLLGCLRPALVALTTVWIAGADGGENAERAAASMRRELGEGFEVAVVDGVFAVASDAPAAERRQVLDALRRTHRALEAELFEAAPARPIRIYLFADLEGYEAYCRRRFGREPSTRLGFYRHRERVAVVNLAAGSGTVCHEVVHPLLARDFPGAPPWLDEGLASLFDSPEFTAGGRIRGRVNWRLPELQASIREGRAVPLDRLLSMTADEFYGPGSSLHYATAKHLCFYLQERGLLASFYRAFRDGRERDSRGIRALEAAVGEDLEAFEARWRKWVARIVFPWAEVRLPDLPPR